MFLFPEMTALHRGLTSLLINEFEVLEHIL